MLAVCILPCRKNRKNIVYLQFMNFSVSSSASFLPPGDVFFCYFVGWIPLKQTDINQKVSGNSWTKKGHTENQTNEQDTLWASWPLYPSPFRIWIVGAPSSAGRRNCLKWYDVYSHKLKHKEMYNAMRFKSKMVFHPQ